MQPLLSICIPTYNRSEQLKETIDSIVSQQEFIDGRVELVISDNASTDDTERVVKDYLTKYPKMIYNRNEVNVRDENFPVVLSCANGKLRKLNNDTLKINKNALFDLCKVVNKYEKERPVLFFSNGNLMNAAEESLDFNTFVSKASYITTWIGGFSIWEDDCDSIREDIDGCDKSLWQVRKIYELTSQKNTGVIINKQFGEVLPLKKKNISYGLYQVFYENYTSFLLPYVDNGMLGKDVFESIEKDLLFNFFSDWMLEWESQNDGFEYSESEDLVKLVTSRYNNKPYWNSFIKEYKTKRIKKRMKRIIGKK